jgi:hypothetical protein
LRPLRCLAISSASKVEITVRTATEVVWSRGRHGQFVFGIDRAFIIQGKAPVTRGRRGDTVASRSPFHESVLQSAV